MGAAVAGVLTGKVTPPQPLCLFPTSLEPVAFTSLNPASPFLTSFRGQSSPACGQEAKPPFWASPTPTTKPLVSSGPTSRRPGAAGAAPCRVRLHSRECRPWAALVPGTGGVDRTPPWSPGWVAPRCACDTDEETGAPSYTWYLACHPRATTAAEAGRAQVCDHRAAVSGALRPVCALGRPNTSSLQSLETLGRFGVGVDSGIGKRIQNNKHSHLFCFPNFIYYLFLTVPRLHFHEGFSLVVVTGLIAVLILWSRL